MFRALGVIGPKAFRHAGGKKNPASAADPDFCVITRESGRYTRPHFWDKTLSSYSQER